MIETFGYFILGALLFLAYKVGYEEGKSDEEERQRLKKIKQMMGRDDEDNE